MIMLQPHPQKMSSPKSEIGKFRSSSPLQKSHSGSALSSLIDHSHHTPVYIPGQHSELSTAFLHKHKRGGNVRRLGGVVDVEKRSVSASDDINTSVNSIPRASTVSEGVVSVLNSTNGSNSSTKSSSKSPLGTPPLNSRPFIPITDDDSPSLTDNDSDNITIKASPSTSSDDNDDSPEANNRRKQKMIRKKSGELVKSSLKLPSLLRTQSMPTKMVHFDSNLEHVRKFFRREKPTAVSSGSATPVKEKVSFQWASGSSDTDSDSDSESDSEEELTDSEDEVSLSHGALLKRHLRNNKTHWQIALPNFTHQENSDKPVYLDSVFLSSDNSNLIGHICVKNMSYKKYVSVRYTIDFWKTVTEIVADYNGDVRRKMLRSGYDRFTFSIRLSDLPQNALTSNSMFFCVRYQSDAGELWDNNDTLNYEVLFTKVSKKQHKHNTKPEQSNSSKNQANSYFTYQPTNQSLQSHHGRNGNLKHHRRTKTDPSPDFLYDNDFDHHHSVDETNEVFEGLSMGNNNSNNTNKNIKTNNTNNTNLNINTNPNTINNTNPTTNTNYLTSTLSPTKKSNGLTSRYSFGASLNAALARKNMTGRRSSYDGDADEEITTTSESTSDDESIDSTPTNTDSTTTPQLRSFIFPKTTTSVRNPTERPAWDSLSYKDIISKYCFFQDTPTPPHHSHHHRSISTTTPTPIEHQRQHHHRPTSTSFMTSTSPMTTSPGLMPQSATPPYYTNASYESSMMINNSLTSPLESSSSTLSSPSTPANSYSPSPTEAPSSPGESSSDTLLDVSEPRKLWHSVEV